MSSMLLVLILAVLNMAPECAVSFDLDMGGNKTIALVRQADGGWKVKAEPDQKGEGPAFYLDGTSIKIKDDKREQKIDQSEMLGTKDKIDWKQVKELKVGPAVLVIDRKPDGADFLLKEPAGRADGGKIIKARWIEKK